VVYWKVLIEHTPRDTRPDRVEYLRVIGRQQYNVIAQDEYQGGLESSAHINFCLLLYRRYSRSEDAATILGLWTHAKHASTLHSQLNPTGPF
jgi:hypothetical protein